MSITLPTHVEERLRSDKLAWLITVRPDGRPHSVPLWFFWDGTTILIFSKPKTQKIRNLRHNPSVILAIDDTKNGQSVITLEGTASLTERRKEIAALQVYGEKYSEGLRKLGVPVEAFTTLYSQPIRITPTRLIAGQ